MTLDSFNDRTAPVIALAVAILWQSTLLAGLVAGICRLLRRSAPALRYWCWQIVALKLLLMPWWIVALPLPGFLGAVAPAVTLHAPPTTENHEARPGVAIASIVAPLAGEAEHSASETPGAFDFLGRLTWRSWLVLAWLGGIAWQLGRLLARRYRLTRLLGRAAAATEPRLLAVMEQVSRQLGLSGRPALVITDEVNAPFVYGLSLPVVVLPRGLMDELDPEYWREVLLHELGHVKRRDLWWGWLPAIARLVYFFHPVVHWVGFRIRLERELACDQFAMTLGGRSAAEYAEILVRVVSHASMPAVLAIRPLEGLSTFWKRRLTMLPSTRRSSPRLSRRSWLAVVSAAMLACLLPTIRNAPAQAQRQPAQAGAETTGRIYVSAALRYSLAGQNEEKTEYSTIIAIDPATGSWQKIAGDGHDGRVAPDGKTLVFSRFGAGIWKCASAGGNNPSKISDLNGRPIWSRDGKYLVTTRQEDLDKDNEKDRKTPAWKCETWRMDADGRNPIKLPIPETTWVEDWSADGQWFVAGTDRHPPYGHGYQLYLMKTDGTHERRLTNGGLNVYARFSPDGKKVLYLRQTRKEGNSIWTMDVDGTNAREIVKEVDLASPNGAYWSPDGKYLAVSLFNWELDEKGEPVHRAGSGKANPRIEIMNADGTNRRQLKLQKASFEFIGSLGDWR